MSLSQAAYILVWSLLNNKYMYDLTHMWNLNKKIELTATENRLVVARDGGGGANWVKVIKRCKFPVVS